MPFYVRDSGVNIFCNQLVSWNQSPTVTKGVCVRVCVYTQIYTENIAVC